MKNEFEKTIDYKQAHIKANMDAKEEGIFISGSSRMATDVVVNLFSDMQEAYEKPLKRSEAIKKVWEEWQQYFYNYMKSKMPQPPTCSLCNTEMLMSSKGNWYCPNLYKNFEGNPHTTKTELPPNEKKFSDSLKS